jgi:hypothetical protein
VGDDGGARHPDPYHEDRFSESGPGELLVPDDLLDRAETLRVEDAHPIEKDLVEVRAPGHLPQRLDLDTGRAHVQQEVGDPRMLGNARISAGQQDPEVRVVGARAPGLLSRHHPFVTVPHGACTECREVGAGPGLAEELAPDLFAAQHGGQVARLLLGAAVGDDGGARHPDPYDEDRFSEPGPGELLVPDDLLDRAETLAPILLWPQDRRPALGLEGALPLAIASDELLLVARLVVDVPEVFGDVLLEEGAGAGAERGFGFGVAKVHGAPLRPGTGGVENLEHVSKISQHGAIATVFVASDQK